MTGLAITRTGIIVAEDMALMRDGLVALLADAWAHGAVRPAATLEDVAALLAGDSDCVLLLDLALLGDAGPAGLQALRERFTSLRIVALAGRETRDGILQCLAAGAHGYIAKSAPFAELARAIEVVRAGGVHVPAGLVAPQAAPGPGPAAMFHAAPPAVSALTGRQQDVLRLLAEGRSTKDIARTLDLAVSTIKVHLAAVYRAVGAHNRVEALCRAGLLPGARLSAVS